MNNPWGLSDRECQIATALVEHGCAKGAGIALGLVHRDACNRIRRIAKLMGVSNDVQVALKWDRWNRRVEYIKPAYGVQDCQHCKGLGFVQRRAA